LLSYCPYPYLHSFPTRRSSDLLQTYNSFRIRYAAGMDIADDAERLKIAASRFLIADDPDTKFGTLEGTPLDGILKAVANDQETVAAVGAKPPHYLTGELDDLSAEAIAEAAAATAAKAADSKPAAGAVVKQPFRAHP